MSQVIRTSKGSQCDIASQQGPITNFPLELKVEIFKFVVLSSEENRSHAVKTLCLVDKNWNNIANATSDLWTKVTLTYPFLTNKLSAAQKWLVASAQKPIDVEIILHDPEWDICTGADQHPLAIPGRLQAMIVVLQGTEHRWRSLSIRSDTWSPVCEFFEARSISDLPSLESLCIERHDEVLAAMTVRLLPWEFTEPPIQFGSDGPFMPRLREASIIGIPVHHESAAASLRNLRKLEIKYDSHNFGPNLQYFASFLASSPELEVLEVTGYGPVIVQAWQPWPSPVHLPALKHLKLGWTCPDFACNILLLLQIPETLETLVLSDTESGLGSHRLCGSGLFSHHEDSSGILETLEGLGSEASRGEDLPGPWISMRGLKRLSISWVKSKAACISAFMKRASMVEEIRLTDVNLGVLEGIAEALAEPGHFKSLKKICIQWIWNGGFETEEAGLFTDRIRDVLGGKSEVVVRELRRGGWDLVPIELEALLDEENAERGP